MARVMEVLLERRGLDFRAMRREKVNVVSEGSLGARKVARGLGGEVKLMEGVEGEIWVQR